MFFKGNFDEYTILKNCIWRIFCNIIHVFTVTFHLFNASSLNKNIIIIIIFFFFFYLINFLYLPQTFELYIKVSTTILSSKTYFQYEKFK